jgi:hypothetical protein
MGSPRARGALSVDDPVEVRADLGQGVLRGLALEVAKLVDSTTLDPGLGPDESDGLAQPGEAVDGMALTARLGKRAPGLPLRLVQEASLTIVPFTKDHWRVVVEAYAQFGKGRHAAGLSFGD